MFEDLDENYQACGFCSRPTHETLRFNDAQLEFLEIYLDVKGVSLPTRVCRACMDEVIYFYSFCSFFSYLFSYFLCTSL